MKRGILPLAGGTLALAALIVCGGLLLPKEREPVMPSVGGDAGRSVHKLAYAVRGDMELRAVVTCRFMSLKQEHLNFEEAGCEVEEVSVRVGDEVKQGQLLAKLKNEELDKELELAREETERIARDLELARSSLDIVRNSWDLYEETEKYQRTVTRLEQDGELAEERLRELEQEREKECLFAGIDGTVTAVDLSEKSTANSARVTISDLSNVCFYADTEYSDAIPPGMEVTLTTDEGEIHTVVTEAEELGIEKESYVGKNQKRVYFLVRDGGEAAALGSPGQAKLDLLLDSRKDVLTIPSKAVFFAGGQAYVYYEGENGVRETKPVELGLRTRTPGAYEVLSGLTGDEALIIG